MTDSFLNLWSIKLAALLAQEAGLPPGNFWESGISRSLVKMGRELGAGEAEQAMRFRLGLQRP